MPSKAIQADAGSGSNMTESANGKSQELTALLEKARKSLEEGQVQKAMEMIGRSRMNSPWLNNLLGICHMRLGDYVRAVDIFRGLVLVPGGLLVRKEAPAQFKTNYATALFLDGNISGCQSILAEMKDEKNGNVERLRQALEKWQAGLTFWQKIQWMLGQQPDRKTTLEYLPGDL